MPNPLLNATCGDGYTNAATISDVWNSRGGWFVVDQYGVYFQLQYGVQGASYWGDELSLGAGSSGTVPSNCIGMRFRNLTAGQNAIVSGQIAYGDQPLVDISFPGAAAASAGFTIIAQGHTTGTHGTPTALSTTLPVSSIVVRALPTNTGLVYLGKSNVTTSTGYELSAGDALGMDVVDPAGVYFDVDTTSEGVSWLAIG